MSFRRWRMKRWWRQLRADIGTDGIVGMVALLASIGLGLAGDPAWLGLLLGLAACIIFARRIWKGWPRTARVVAISDSAGYIWTQQSVDSERDIWYGYGGGPPLQIVITYGKGKK